MKDVHWKVAFAMAIAILIAAVALWMRGFRQPTPNPSAKSFADSIRESMGRADRNAETSQRHQQDYEANYRKYMDSVPYHRDSFRARIWNDAQAADSLRELAPR